MNVVGYIRVSTQGQARDGYSLKYQDEEIKAYCEEQGWNSIHTFRDEGISGAKLNEEAIEINRVGLQEVLAHLSSVQSKVIIYFETTGAILLGLTGKVVTRGANLIDGIVNTLNLTKKPTTKVDPQKNLKKEKPKGK